MCFVNVVPAELRNLLKFLSYAFEIPDHECVALAMIPDFFKCSNKGLEGNSESVKIRNTISWFVFFR